MPPAASTTSAAPTPAAADSAASASASADEPPASTDPRPQHDPPRFAIEWQIAPGVRAAQRLDLRWLTERLSLAARTLAREDRIEIASVNVLIVDDAGMQRLHQRHRGPAHTTDALSFDLRESPSDPVQADLVVCVDEAARRSAELGHAVDRELLLYALHGLLHGAGYDDADAESARRMHAREDEILTSIGVGAIFSAGEPGRPGEAGA